MRNLTVVAVVVLASSGLALAEDGGTNRVSAFVSDLGYSESRSTGSNFSAGYGLALNHWWSPRFSTELSASTERRSTRIFAGTSQGDVTFTTERFRAIPVDLTAQYHFVNQSRWKPYIGAGMHVFTARSFVENVRLSTQLNGGVLFDLTPRVALRFDMKQLLSDSNPSYDPGNKASFGVSWKF